MHILLSGLIALLPVLVFLLQDEGLDAVADLHDLVRIDVVRIESSLLGITPSLL